MSNYDKVETEEETEAGEARWREEERRTDSVIVRTTDTHRITVEWKSAGQRMEATLNMVQARQIAEALTTAADKAEENWILQNLLLLNQERAGENIIL